MKGISPCSVGFVDGNVYSAPINWTLACCSGGVADKGRGSGAKQAPDGFIDMLILVKGEDRNTVVHADSTQVQRRE